MDGGPAFQELDRARALTADEERIARHLAAALGPEAVTQLESAEVTGACRCGCSSVRLAASGTEVGPGGAHVGVSATGRGPDGDVTLTLHLVGGLISELELFDPDRGEGHAVDPSSVTAIGMPEVV